MQIHGLQHTHITNYLTITRARFSRSATQPQIINSVLLYSNRCVMESKHLKSMQMSFKRKTIAAFHRTTAVVRNVNPPADDPQVQRTH